MRFELRQPTQEEFAEFARVNYAGFGMAPTDEDIAQWRELFDFERGLAAFDAERLVGTAGAFAYELTLPGGATVPVPAVTWVAVLPTDRRRGVLRAIMRRQLDDTRRRGEPVAVLMASESAIYGRFGYGVATSAIDVEIARSHAALRQPWNGSGRVRLMERERALEVFPALWERHRRAQHGALTRPVAWWEQLFRQSQDGTRASGPRFYVVYENASGEPEGAAWYRVAQQWEHGLPNSTLVIGDMVAPALEPRAALWDYLLGVDLISTVRAVNVAVDEPLRWMLADPRRLRVTRLVDDLWVRLLDIPAALAARRYATTDRLVIEVADAFLPENAGRYALAGGPVEAMCEKTAEAADLALEVADLGAAYLGGVSFTTLAQAGRVRELRAGALRRADTLFATATAPYSGTNF